LDPVYRGSFLQQYDKNQASQFAKTFSKHAKVDETSLRAELLEWNAQSGRFDLQNLDRSEAWSDVDYFKDTLDRKLWWPTHFGDTALSTIYQMLSAVPISSCACERTWSIRGHTHSKSRNRYVFSAYYKFCLE